MDRTWNIVCKKKCSRLTWFAEGKETSVSHAIIPWIRKTASTICPLRLRRYQYHQQTRWHTLFQSNNLFARNRCRENYVLQKSTRYKLEDLYFFFLPASIPTNEAPFSYLWLLWKWHCFTKQFAHMQKLKKYIHMTNNPGSLFKSCPQNLKTAVKKEYSGFQPSLRVNWIFWKVNWVR